MKKFLLLIAFLIAPSALTVAADEAQQGVISTLKNYIEGSSYNNQVKLNEAFNDSAILHLEKANTANWEVPVSEYVSWFNPKSQGEFNGRIANILHIDIEDKIATAKVEILIPAKDVRFIDLFLLKQMGKDWKILSKSATSQPSNDNGKRILFIVSNAHFHGDSELPTGVSFSEIVNAYDTFKQAGYTVDFVSPLGGAIPLAYINTSTPIHKQYLYNTDFMFAIGNTLKPGQIKPENYQAVHYVGGGNAMYGVADNESIQKISMEIYEQHGGIISSVCHGTAGIVNLKTQDGKYLVEGKRISGYPDSFENPNKAYFKEFPFLIQQTIEQRNGTFIHAPRNQVHVEIDGRIITGQNYLSSSLVAKHIISYLNSKNID